MLLSLCYVAKLCVRGTKQVREPQVDSSEEGELSPSDAQQQLLVLLQQSVAVLLKELCPVSRKLLREAGFSSPPQRNDHQCRV